MGWRAQTQVDWLSHCPGTEDCHRTVVRERPEEPSSSQWWSGCKEESGQGWGRHSHKTLPGSPQWLPLQTPGSLRGTCRWGGHAAMARRELESGAPALRRLGCPWVWVLVRTAVCSALGSAWATSQHNSSDKQHDLDWLSHLLGGGVERSVALPLFIFSPSLALWVSSLQQSLSDNLKAPLLFSFFVSAFSFWSLSSKRTK